MAETMQAVKGMNDLLPPDSTRWGWLESVVIALMRRYGYSNIRTPIVEPTSLFVRGLGEVTDIVEKEMYSFIDSMNGDPLTLRPEGTAGVVRAVNQHALLHDGGKRLFYIGPMFRHERPQKGRYRQFHQVGVEALGFVGPDIDAEQILMTRALWQALGLQVGTDLHLELNTLGQADERSAHRAALVAHFEQHLDLLDEEGRRRLYSNPLRILDTKNPAMKPVIESAPQLLSFLGADSLAHFAAIRQVLDDVGVPYRINPRLVRGMDYYNLTVFEWVTDRLGAQGTICGGGRYDGLVQQLGGRPAPGVGWGLGIERLLLLLEALGVAVPVAPVDVYVVVPNVNAMSSALSVSDHLRTQGVAVLMNAAGKEGWGSMKSQFKRADASGARYALVFGEAELAQGAVALKDLRESGEQRLLRLADIGTWALGLRASG